MGSVAASRPLARITTSATVHVCVWSSINSNQSSLRRIDAMFVCSIRRAPSAKAAHQSARLYAAAVRKKQRRSVNGDAGDIGGFTSADMNPRGLRQSRVFRDSCEPGRVFRIGGQLQNAATLASERHSGIAEIIERLQGEAPGSHGETTLQARRRGQARHQDTDGISRCGFRHVAVTVDQSRGPSTAYHGRRHGTAGDARAHDRNVTLSPRNCSAACEPRRHRRRRHR